jgi:hypothetical protein
MTRVVDVLDVSDVLNEGAVKVARMRAQRALRFFKILFSISYSTSISLFSISNDDL